jgi:hypothetical protein
MEALRTLKQCLIDIELAHLRIIARLWGLELTASRPLELAAELALALANPAHAADTWETLPGDQRAALKALIDAGGLMPVAAFKRRFGEIRPIGPGRLERETPWRDPISPAEGLWYRGLIYGGFAGEQGETYPVVFVPAELLAALPVKADSVERIIQVPVAAPPPHADVAGDLLLHDLTTVLAFIHNESVQPSGDAPGAWPKETRAKLVRNLRDPDVGRLSFLLHLLEQLEWTRLSGEGRLRLAAEPVMEWLQGTAEESRTVLVDAWRGMADWIELWRLTTLEPHDSGGWRHDPTLARVALLRYLEAMTPGEWVRVDDFVAAVKAEDPDFQRPGGDYEAWYVRDAHSGDFLTGFESWDRVEGTLLRALLSGPAWWLGLVELGREAQGGAPVVFRRVAVASPVGDLPLPTVRPDLTITMPAARPLQRFQLARVADLVGAGDLYIYRLTPASLSRARRQRIDPERVVEFLDDLSDTPLPGAVSSSLMRWAQRGTEVWIERAVLLRVADEAVLQEILASPKTGPYVERTVGATVAVVAEEHWPRLLDALAELGLLAKVDEVS